MKRVLFVFTIVCFYFPLSASTLSYDEYYSFFKLDDEMFREFAIQTVYYGSPSNDDYRRAYRALETTFIKLGEKEGRKVFINKNDKTIPVYTVWIEYLSRYINAYHRHVFWLEKRTHMTFDKWLSINGGKNLVNKVFCEALKEAYDNISPKIDEDLRKELLVINRDLYPEDQYYSSVIEKMWRKAQKKAKKK